MTAEPVMRPRCCLRVHAGSRRSATKPGASQSRVSNRGTEPQQSAEPDCARRSPPRGHKAASRGRRSAEGISARRRRRRRRATPNVDPRCFGRLAQPPAIELATRPTRGRPFWPPKRFSLSTPSPKTAPGSCSRPAAAPPATRTQPARKKKKPLAQGNAANARRRKKFSPRGSAPWNPTRAKAKGIK